MSDNWIVQNLNSALNTWNEKLSEIWTLLTQSPESFKGGDIWSVITGINGALTAIGYGLLVLFFAAGIVKTCGSFTDMKKPCLLYTSLYAFSHIANMNIGWQRNLTPMWWRIKATIILII